WKVRGSRFRASGGARKHHTQCRQASGSCYAHSHKSFLRPNLLHFGMLKRLLGNGLRLCIAASGVMQVMQHYASLPSFAWRCLCKLLSPWHPPPWVINFAFFSKRFAPDRFAHLLVWQGNMNPVNNR